MLKAHRDTRGTRIRKNIKYTIGSSQWGQVQRRLNEISNKKLYRHNQKRSTNGLNKQTMNDER